MGSTLLTAGIVLGVTSLFIFFFSLLHKRGKQKKLADQQLMFDQLVTSNNLTINQKEDFDKYMIAIDRRAARLVYIDFSNTHAETKLIDLLKIKTVRVDVEETSIYEDRKGQPVFVEKQRSKLQLELAPIDASRQKQVLPLYQLHKDAMHDFNTIKRRAEYWQHYLNTFIKSLPVVASQDSR